MTAPRPITLTVNGRAVTRAVEPRTHLVDFLRETLGLTGSHLTCEHGVCGACTVKVDGEIVRGCLMLAVQAEDAIVETIENESAEGELTPLQESFCARNALQCGWCTPGMILSAQSLIEGGASLDRDGIRDALSGNYCRCTGYHAIVDAVEAASRGAAPHIEPKPVASAEGYIGRPVPRANARRLVQGAGSYVDDIPMQRLAHAAFLRSPHAHGRIVRLDTAAAASMPGVIAVATGKEIAAHCTPWVGVLTHLTGMKSPPQYPLAIERACWQGEPVAVVVAESRAQAEDAVERIAVDWQELPAVTDAETALDPATPVIHPELGDNLAFRREIDNGEVDAAFARAHKVVEATFRTGRHTGVCPEPRAVLADWSADGILTVHHSSQVPHMTQAILAKHLDIPEHRIRILTKDVGGSYGIKIHIYGDEIAAIVMSKILRRPVKFVADRLESFLSDIHARDHRLTGRMAFDGDGRIVAIAMDDLTGIGPYSAYPRSSAVEGNQVLALVGGPYAHKNYRGRTSVVFQNKNMMSQYRAVGHPIAVAATEGLIDLAASEMDIDPVELRRRNLIPDDAYPCAGASGLRFEGLSHHRCLDKLVAAMDYQGLRREQADLRKRGVHRGIGIASFIEMTNPSPVFYGVGGAPIAARDGCAVRLEPSGAVTCLSGTTEQGQGTETVLAQIVATAMGVAIDQVRVVTGDTQATPYGGGTWASRGTGIGGEAALQAGRALREGLLTLAGAMLQARPESLDIKDGRIVDGAGTTRIGLDELGKLIYYRGDTLPKGVAAEPMATRHYQTRDYPFAFTNGVQASWLEVDIETGLVKLLKHWVVEDCGRVINPLLADEQVRGGVVQGLGAALFEQCLYDERGQLQNGTMADYLVPMAGEMPDIEVAHIETPTAQSDLGAKGIGEAGVAGAPAAVMNGINDALAPFGARLFDTPLTPQRILQALGRV